MAAIKIKYSRVLLFLFLLAGLSSCQKMLAPVGGNFSNDILGQKEKLSTNAKELIEEALITPNGKCAIDFHVHAVGMGKGGTGAWVNPKMTDFWHFLSYLKYLVYSSAGGITAIETADEQYASRLVALQRAEPRMGKLVLLAFDYFHDEDGTPQPKRSTFYIPNDYVISLAKKFPDVFIPAASIHPYRSDAISELKRVAALGVKFIKWLPNAQHIDASAPKTMAFFKEMKRLGITLITHTGHEKAVEGEEYQKLGNPLLFRSALDLGVKIVMAHLASLGDCEDLDSDSGGTASCFDLFWRLVEENKYEGLLFGELSGTTIYTRFDGPFKKVLENPQFARRFINGSDYPLPAINILYRTGQYVKLGYITKQEKKSLYEIYKYNPLLFNLISKKILKHPKTKAVLDDIIFTNSSLMECN
jgi:hypothetical protein